MAQCAAVLGVFGLARYHLLSRSRCNIKVEGELGAQQISWNLKDRAAALMIAINSLYSTQDMPN